jgi:nucleotide-binding universal stress UspA family protein
MALPRAQDVTEQALSLIDAPCRRRRITALEGQFELLAVGFVGHSNIFGRVMGSTTQNLSRLSPCTVMIVK